MVLALCHLRALDGFLLCMARLYPDLLLMCRIADGLADMTAREAPIFADVLQAMYLGMKTAKIHTVVVEDCQHSCQTRALARQCMDAIGVKGQTCRELSRARRYVERLKWCERNTSSSFSTRSPPNEAVDDLLRLYLQPMITKWACIPREPLEPGFVVRLVTSTLNR